MNTTSKTLKTVIKHKLGRRGQKRRRITKNAFKKSETTIEDKKNKETRKHTQSPLGSAPGTNTLISLDLAVVIDASRDSLLKYNWQPPVLSTEIVGADPYNSHIVGK
jgi:hypothetical protein